MLKIPNRNGLVFLHKGRRLARVILLSVVLVGTGVGVSGPAIAQSSTAPNNLAVRADKAGRLTGFPATLAPGVWQVLLQPGTSVDSVLLMRVDGTRTDRQVRAAILAGSGSADGAQPPWLHLAGGTLNRTAASSATAPSLVASFRLEAGVY
jgi:hypothetical protein